MEKEKVKINTKKNKKTDKSNNSPNNNKIIGIAIGGFVLLVVLAALFVPSSPVSIWNFVGTQHNEEIQADIDELKEMYSEQGIELDDKDIAVETVVDNNGDEQINITVVNESKKNTAKNKAQNELDKIVGEAMGVTPPERDDNGNIINPDDNTQNFPSIEDIFNQINFSNSRVREFLNNSYTKDESYSSPYTQLLLDQRRTGEPSSSSAFPTTINADESPTPYSYFQKLLNGETFLYAQFPNDIFTDEQTYFYPYFATSSETIYNNLLTNGSYNKDFDVNTDVFITPSRENYTLNLTQNNTLTLVSILEANVLNNKVVIGMYNNDLFVLDIK